MKYYEHDVDTSVYIITISIVVTTLLMSAFGAVILAHKVVGLFF